ncbi:MAG: hypothetical protein EAZ06_10100 [Cytophagales bacterium]|nr:MAG: hypothetical protein EAZ06_10100 [Cytophagales bacterium]
MKERKIIKISGTILVNNKPEKVFDFFANPSNDNLWRTEINQSILNGDLELGVKISEYSYLSKKIPNNLIELNCIDFDKNKLAIFETQSNSEFYIKSQRKVSTISDNKTEVIYTLDFDINLVKYALGFALPKFIVSLKANSDLKKYLKQLKTKLEIF